MILRQREQRPRKYPRLVVVWPPGQESEDVTGVQMLQGEILVFTATAIYVQDHFAAEIES